jgi:rubrerythrin
LEGPNVEAQQQLLAWLAEAWRTEQHLAIQLRQIAPTVPYEHFRQRLETMAEDDEQHANLLQPYIAAVVRLPSADRPVAAVSSNSAMGSPWRRLLGVLQEKRELYERYRQEAVFLDDADLQSLLHRLRAEEAQHQEDLVEILTHLDAHVHETIA